ncbi:MAG: SDR family oxidoreductase [Anaerolineae bacterium]|jgi:3-oxoacyl-[acyl-carrier protein] reductase|nr:SDR family oxidoreductase [Anaerolineae bacterium]MBT3712080.1 SDR family oxidoreductase [Anaerolineae bacterium]MBT4310928.1 SDR family oxidoreductase [Anaerolineae bacterium]MBT4456958.1 SDR family oxidoreductase [Anaerolineae bacterium]MBT6060751.1 SDR family oxidoreductase [Anaerolineae bacterium]
MKKTILVSGAGTGIGQSTAKVLADKGYKLVLLGRNKENLEKTRSSLVEPSDHTIIAADIRDAQALKKGLDEVKPLLHGVIANAGLGGENQYSENDRWHKIIETNLTGTYQLVEEALPYFAAKEDGFRHVVLVSSILARLGVPRYTAYCASKAGLLGLMRSWAVELAAQNILVNAIAPGWVNTSMAREGLAAMAEHGQREYDDVLQEQMSHVLLGKMSEPEEIGELIAYLLLQTSITGQTLDINNGAVMPA